MVPAAEVSSYTLIEAVEHISPLASLRGLEVVLIITPDIPLHVSGDAARLRQILINLMANAVKFTASGRVVLRVELSAGSAAASKQGAAWLHFSVSDTGAGISEEVLATIFDRFAPSDSPSPRTFGGTGLALPICKRLVELMGGHIGARKLPDSGSEFWVVLPLTPDKTQLAPAAAPDNLHVVVLDDLSPSRVSVSAMLARLGLDHDVTETVAKAAGLLRDALASGARELVLLLDESVVKDSAEELSRLLAQDAALRATRIVLLAQRPDAATAACEFPVAAVVRKPLVRPEVLLAALRKKSGAGETKILNSRTPFESGEAKPAAPAGPQVLVVDDDEISRSVSAQLLSRLGCVVERAASGAEAIARASAHHFDLIFMDCQMPGIDGFEATKNIRAAAGSKAPPIVALTANTSAADREKCFATGMCDFVDKPVRKVELARILKRWTNQESGAPR